MGTLLTFLDAYKIADKVSPTLSLCDSDSDRLNRYCRFCLTCR